MIFFVADVHVGNPKQHGGPTEAGINRRGLHVLAALNEAMGQANGANSPLVVVGDLFDTVRPEAQLIAKVQEIFQRAGKKPVCILGNHEMVSAAPGDHSLAPLAPVATLVEAPRTVQFRDGRGYENVDIICIPFRPGPAIEWLPDAIAAGVRGETSKSGSPVSPPKVLALHLGLLDADTPPWLKDSHDAVPVKLVASLAKQWGITAVYAGNWHDRKTWNIDGIRIEQIGALHPTGWNNPGLDYGYVSVFGGDFKPRRVAGARFVTVKKAADLKKFEGLSLLYVKSTASAEDEPEILQRLTALQDMGTVVAFEHDRAADGEEVAAARTALVDARAAARTGGDSLAEYINAMPLAEGVDRRDVLEKARTLLGGTP